MKHMFVKHCGKQKGAGEGIFALKRIVMGSCWTCDIVGLVCQPLCFAIREDNLGFSSKVGKDVGFSILRVLGERSIIASVQRQFVVVPVHSPHSTIF